MWMTSKANFFQQSLNVTVFLGLLFSWIFILSKLSSNEALRVSSGLLALARSAMSPKIMAFLFDCNY